MADRTEFIPLGGSVQQTDVNAQTEVMQNFVPVIASPSIGGKQQLRLFKRRGYQNRMVAKASGYSHDAGMQWSGVLGSGTTPYTSRGVIAYTAHKISTDLKLYQWDSSETTLGTFATAGYRCIGIQETLISGTPNLTLNIALEATGAQKLLFFPNGGALTEVTDGDFPVTSIGRGVHMDGYYFVASTDGYIYNSDLNSLSAWTSTSRIAVQMEPDTLVGLAKIGNTIVALGTKTIERFQNAGNPSGSPLSRIPQATLKIGAINGTSIQEVGEGLLFVSNGPEGIGVHMLDGFAARKVSNTQVDATLQTLGAATSPLYGNIIRGTSFAGVLRHHGVTGVWLAGSSGLIYFPATNVWSTFKYGSSGTTDAFCFEASGTSFALSGSRELLYFQGDSVAATSGSDFTGGQFTAVIQTAPLTHGTAHRKFYKSARLIGDQQTVTTPVSLYSSDDNGANFTVHGSFEMSANPIIPITRLGSSRKRIWGLQNTSAGGCVLDGLELTFEVGTN